jgi:competence protein ComEA
MKRKRFFFYAVLLFTALLSLPTTGCDNKNTLKITPPDEQDYFYSSIYISGAVSIPGIYPLAQDDTIDNLITASGGFSDGDSLNIELYILSPDQINQPQKIDINHAEAWLLEALPGIGEDKALAIITYRQQNDFFSHISQITQVEGIGEGTFTNIETLITVGNIIKTG